MNVQLDNADNPYENIVRPSIRFYNFDRFVTGECTIVFKRFVIVKDADNLLCDLLDDVDCHHFNDWPENAIYCLAAPEKYYEDSRYFYYCCLIKSCIEGFNIHHCALCEHCHTSEGGCRRYGYYMFYLLHDEKINKFEESRLCKRYSVNKKGLQYKIKNIPVPLIEWKR